MSPFTVVTNLFLLSLFGLCASCKRTSGVEVYAFGAEDSSQHLKVMSFNIKASQMAGLEQISDFISASAADVVFLQEVDRSVPRSGSVDQIAILAKYTGYHFAFAPAT